MTQLQLTPAEVGVLELLLQGQNNRSIAQKLVVSVRTVESHISSALGKSGCHSRLQLTLWWMQQSKSGNRIGAGRVSSLPA